ncbi:MAG TPA: hypothetical protein DEF34_03455 [Desulfotomaculum sp.]|nr:MAG: hypothetical protein JL56_03065 [Desulfotomaculum sp. BICA1-6]HBX22685.1 hypothetical protein [Desulfotomaculum sp.]
MTKLYRQPIEVQTRDGLPVAFRWRRRWYQVTSCKVDEQMASRFWRRLYGPLKYKCETKQGMICELTQDEAGWVLERVWD